jgi:hypothetical protein
VKLSGFGNFDLRRKNQRPGRNPKTGEEIPISARTVVTFRPGQKLKERVEAYRRAARMLDPGSNSELPPIPAKRYFTIGEVSELCDVKPHVLRYWETEFPSLKPGQAPRQPPLLPAPRRADGPPDPRPAVRAGLHHRRRRLRLEGEGAKQESALSSRSSSRCGWSWKKFWSYLRR